MKEEIKKMGFIESPKLSVDGWTCFRYKKGFMWFFVNDAETEIRVEPDIQVSFTIEEIKSLKEWLETMPIQK